MNRIRDMRGGKEYDATFGSRMRGEGLWAELIAKRYAAIIAKTRLSERRTADFGRLDCSLFRRPTSVPAARQIDNAGTPTQFDMF